jgi:hypothetical protein
VTYIIAYNTAGTSTTIFPNLNVSGTYYRIGGAGVVAAGGNGQVLNLSAILHRLDVIYSPTLWSLIIQLP